jgi:hypothetical protein
MDVRLHTDAPPDSPSRSIQWKPVLLGVGGVAIVSLGIWLAAWFGRDDSAVDAAANNPSVSISVAETGSSQQQEAAQNSSQSAASTSAQAVDSGAVQGAELPPSVNARADLGIGMRVRIVDGLSLTLRTEAGATAGQEVGYMGNGDQALIVGGPAMTQGNSDTIVWWYVRLDNGVEAWAAANTSEQTLLIPAP